MRDDWTSPEEGYMPDGFPAEIHAVARGANARLTCAQGTLPYASQCTRMRASSPLRFPSETDRRKSVRSPS